MTGCGFSLSVLGAALPNAVMPGLIGIPLALVGFIISLLAAPGWVRPTHRGARRILSTLLAAAAGGTATLCSTLLAIDVSDHLAHHDHTSIGLVFNAIAATGFRGLALTVAAPALAVLAFITGRGRLATRDFGPLALWTAYPPVSLAIMSVLNAIGILVFSA